jgi:uncharacterized protein YvpB
MAAIVLLVSQAVFAPGITLAGTDCAHYGSDINYQDNTSVTGGSTINKGWNIQNCGTNSWSGYTVVRISGSIGPSSFSAPAIGPGATGAVYTGNFTVPTTAGTYKSVYQFRNSSGINFGDQFWVQIAIQSTTTTCADPGANQVTVWTGSNYTSACKTFGLGDYASPAALSPIPNDDANSIKVGSGTKALLCHDDNYGGGCITVTANVADLSTTALGNNQLSSMKVQSTAIAPAVRLAIPQVPFNSQFGSSYTDSTLSSTDYAHGGNNCGPTSLSMAIDYFVAKHVTLGETGSISPLSAANSVRGGAAYNYYGYNGPTNFGLDNSATGIASRNLLGLYGLHLNRVYSFDDIKRELGSGHPVVVLVDNNQYKSANPYGSSPSSTFFTRDHIIVVTGYDAQYVYINDPLRAINSAPDFAIATAQFTAAALNTSVAPGTWYGAAVSP